MDALDVLDVLTEFPEMDEPLNIKPTIPETSLWQAVIMQAVLDTMITAPRQAEKLAKADAISWFEGDGRNFRLVCSNANMCPRWVRDRAIKLMKTKLTGKDSE